MKDKPEALQRRADRQECRKRDRSRVLSRSLCRASSFTRVECVAEAVATVVSLFWAVAAMEVATRWLEKERRERGRVGLICWRLQR